MPSSPAAFNRLPECIRNADRTSHHLELEAILASRFMTKPRDHWLRLLSDAAVPCAPIANVEEVARNPHLDERGMILRADHPGYPDLIVPGSPFKNTGSRAIPATRAPSLGEHTDAVLGRVLGYDSGRLSELRNRGII